MTKIRLRRRGRKQYPIYDIVVVDSRGRRDGKYIEKLGQYNPMTSPSIITVNDERAMYWLRTGAQPTDITRHLLSTQGLTLRLHLERKGVSNDEIDAAIVKHKANVAARVQRVLAKKAKKREAAPAAPAPAEEAA